MAYGLKASSCDPLIQIYLNTIQKITEVNLSTLNTYMQLLVQTSEILWSQKINIFALQKVERSVH